MGCSPSLCVKSIRPEDIKTFTVKHKIKTLKNKKSSKNKNDHKRSRSHNISSCDSIEDDFSESKNKPSINSFNESFSRKGSKSDLLSRSQIQEEIEELNEEIGDLEKFLQKETVRRKGKDVKYLISPPNAPPPEDKFTTIDIGGEYYSPIVYKKKNFQPLQKFISPTKKAKSFIISNRLSEIKSEANEDSSNNNTLTKQGMDALNEKNENKKRKNSGKIMWKIQPKISVKKKRAEIIPVHSKKVYKYRKRPSLIESQNLLDLLKNGNKTPQKFQRLMANSPSPGLHTDVSQISVGSNSFMRINKPYNIMGRNGSIDMPSESPLLNQSKPKELKFLLGQESKILDRKSPEMVSKMSTGLDNINLMHFRNKVKKHTLPGNLVLLRKITEKNFKKTLKSNTKKVVSPPKIKVTMFQDNQEHKGDESFVLQAIVNDLQNSAKNIKSKIEESPKSISGLSKFKRSFSNILVSNTSYPLESIPEATKKKAPKVGLINLKKVENDSKSIIFSTPNENLLDSPDNVQKKQKFKFNKDSNSSNKESIDIFNETMSRVSNTRRDNITFTTSHDNLLDETGLQNINQYVIVGDLGIGGYAKVKKAKNKKTKEFFVTYFFP